MSLVGNALIQAAIMGRARSRWEDTLRDWAKPPGVTAEQRTENAVRMIRQAIADHPGLLHRHIDVFAQGSYRNNTNIRDDSDVDVCILCTDSFFSDYSESGLTDARLGHEPAAYTFSSFKNAVHDALEYKFGASGVSRRNKHFDVHENSYRLDADVVACFEHRLYIPDGRYIPGTQFIADDGRHVVNWPEQHHRNGVTKNESTRRRFKYVARALKRLRAEMEGVGVPEARSVASFLVESLVWNAPDELFADESYTTNLVDILFWGIGATEPAAGTSALVEVNRIKPLFGPGQPWTSDATNSFLKAAVVQLGFR
jgi:hypothetical protein